MNSREVEVLEDNVVESIVRHVRKPVVLEPAGGQAVVALPTADNGYVVAGDIELRAPEPRAVALHTLSGLVTYLRSQLDKLAAERLAVHVISPGKVELLSCLEGFYQQRLTYVSCEAEGPRFQFGRWMSVEEFVISLQSIFLDSGDRAAVLKVFGNLKEQTTKKTQDDGVTQVVTASAGIVREAEVPVPNPVLLQPYRTFSEVEQPLSKFVLRLQQGPQVALFEADGGAWRLKAIENIVAYLTAEKLGVSIIA